MKNNKTAAGFGMLVTPAVAMLAASRFAPEDDKGFRHDRILAANDSLFVEGNFSQPLTTFSMGWRDPADIGATLEALAPACPVPRRFEYTEFPNAEEFYSDTDDLRATGADFKGVEHKGLEKSARTYNHGLKIQIDLDQVADQVGWKEQYTQKLLRRLLRNSLRRAAGVHIATGVNAAVTWSGGAADCDAVLNDTIITATDASGVRPNRIVFGDSSWANRWKGHRAQDTAGSIDSAGLSPEKLAALLQLDLVHVSRERWQSSASGKSQFVGNQVFLFNAESGLLKDDASNIKRFTSPCEGGMPIKVYERQIAAKLYEIVVEHYEYICPTSALGWRRLTVS